MMTGGYTSPDPSGSSLKCDICYQVCWCSTREMSTRLNIRRCSADPDLKYIGWCTCLHPIILYPKIDGEFYPRCLECCKFYEVHAEQSFAEAKKILRQHACSVCGCWFPIFYTRGSLTQHGSLEGGPPGSAVKKDTRNKKARPQLWDRL